MNEIDCSLEENKYMYAQVRFSQVILTNMILGSTVAMTPVYRTKEGNWRN